MDLLKSTGRDDTCPGGRNKRAQMKSWGRTAQNAQGG